MHGLIHPSREQFLADTLLLVGGHILHMMPARKGKRFSMALAIRGG
jgi:hypothetical protein